MKILHISDVHIRNLKYHSEYREVFGHLYDKIDELQPDLVVNTGDTAHTKTHISPEYVEMCSTHIREVSKRKPYIIIPGNHDMNLMNLDRQDAITPIVDSIDSPSVHFWKSSGLHKLNGVNFWVFSLADQDNYPTPDQWEKYPNDINIGLFHGSVTNCVTDSNWRMTHVEHDFSIFKGLDYVLMGDIHKQQFFKDRHAAYAGSLIQQNFGEEVNKGFLFWDIKSKIDHLVTPVYLPGGRKFHTIKLLDDLSVPEVEVTKGARIRISPPRPLTLTQQKSIEKIVKQRYKPHDVITLSATNMGSQRSKTMGKSFEIENLRQLGVQERLIREWLKEREIPEKIVEKILGLNRKYQVSIEQNDDAARNVNWRIDRICWNNLFNYGEGNVLDFSALGGLTGLFGPNASGKSNLIDILMETCFDSVTKGVSKNVFLINDNKEVAHAIAEVTANDQHYIIDRSIERIKYGQRKFDEAKEWGKTNLTFSRLDDAGGEEPLTGQSRPETERAIRNRCGTFEDFMLTSLSAQWNPMDLVACKETKRKEIFYKFFDLDVFDQKMELAKLDSREKIDSLRQLEDSNLERHATELRLRIEEHEKQSREKKEESKRAQKGVEQIDQAVEDLTSQKVKVEVDIDIAATALKVKRSEMEMVSIAQKISDREERLNDVEGQIAELLAELALPKLAVADAEERYEAVRSELEQTKIKLSQASMKVAEHKKNLVILDQVPCGDQFPTCKFLINAFDSKSKVPMIQETIEDLKAKLASLTEQKDQLELSFKDAQHRRELNGKRENLLAQVKNLKLQIENYRLQLEKLRSEKDLALADVAKYEQAEADLVKNRELDKKIQEQKFVKSKHLFAIKKLDAEVNDLSRMIGADQGILEKISGQLDEIQDLRDTCAAYEHYISAMGKDGIAYHILAQKLPVLNEEINKILANAADFSVFIEHDSEEQSIRFFLQYGEYKSRLLELGSGAEKFLASVAIRTALLNISTLPKTNLFIIDEGFGKLDSKNLENVQRMFDYLRSVFDHVIVISHLDTMKDMVDNVIEISADDEGYAHVEVGT